MRNLFLLCLMIVVCHIHAQTKVIDSLYHIITTTKEAKVKIDALNSYAYAYRMKNKDSTKLIASQVLELSKKIGYGVGMGEAYYNLGIVYYLKNNDSALFYFKKSYQQYQLAPPGLLRAAKTFTGITNTFIQLTKFDSAIFYGQAALAYIKTSKDLEKIKTERLMYAYGSLANTYYNASDYEKSSSYYIKASEIGEQIQNNDMLVAYYSGIANIHAVMENYNKAIYYGNKSGMVAKQIQDHESLILALANMGAYYAKMKDVNNSYKYADSSLKLGTQHNYKRYEGRNYLTYGNNKMFQNNCKEALYMYTTGLESAATNKASNFIKYVLLRETGNAYQCLDSMQQAKAFYLRALKSGEGDADHEADCYHGLSQLYLKLGDYTNAYTYLSKYKMVHDSIFTDEKAHTITEMNTRFETEKKEQQLVILEKDKALQFVDLQRKQQEIINAKLFASEQAQLLVSSNLKAEKQQQQIELQGLSLEVKQSQLQKQQLDIINTKSSLEIEKQQKQLNLATIDQQRNKFLLLLLSLLAVIIIAFLLLNRYKLKSRVDKQQALLDERQRLSRELHDEVGATLSGISLYSHLAKEQMKTMNTLAVEKSLDIMQSGASEMVGKLNEIVWLLNPMQDSLEQLIERLEEYAANMTATKNMEVKVQAESIIHANLSSGTRRGIYLLCKEAINNAVKYSGASLLTVNITQIDGKLVFVIADNGTGFDTESIKKGNGLLNMQSRAKELRATCSIDSKPRTGTTITLICKITQ